MASKLRSVFSPTIEEIERFQTICEEAHRDAVKNRRCTACKYYSYDGYVPGFIAYEGDCERGHVAWFGDNPDGLCIDWEEE